MYEYGMYVNKTPYYPDCYKDVYNNDYIDVINEFEAGVANLYGFEYDYTQKKPTLEEHKNYLFKNYEQQ